MKLDDLASGAVYVDTNVWHRYFRTDPAHQQTLTTFFGRVVRGAIEAFVEILVLDELFYRLPLAHVKDATGRNLLEVLCADLPGAIAADDSAIDTALLVPTAPAWT
jgi:predicted nucleic acid-binding protein